MNICISWILQQTANHSHAYKYKLWFISSLRTVRAETSCIPTKNVLVSPVPRPIRHYHWNSLFHWQPRIEVVLYADVSEKIFLELKVTLWDLHILANALNVPLCPLIFSWWGMMLWSILLEWKVPTTSLPTFQKDYLKCKPIPVTIKMYLPLSTAFFWKVLIEL